MKSGRSVAILGQFLILRVCRRGGGDSASSRHPDVFSVLNAVRGARRSGPRSAHAYSSLTSRSIFNALVNAGIVHPTAVLICPFIAATSGTNSGFGDFRPSETLYVRLPADTEISDTEILDTETTKAEEIDASHKDKHEDTEQPKQAEQTKSEQKQSEQKQSEQKPHRRHRVQSPWTPLRLVAHHSYVVGMRVSGIVHRAIVRLEFDK